MKRLRLKRFWVVFAIVILLAPLLSGKMQKTDATQPGQTETSSSGVTASYTLKFSVGDQLDDGSSMPRFDLLIAENPDVGFVTPNTGNLKVGIYIGDELADDLEDTYELEWKVLVNGEDISLNTSDVMTITEKAGSTLYEKLYDMSVKAAGILRFDVSVRGWVKGEAHNENNVALNVDRHALITVPLQIYHKNELNSWVRRYPFVDLSQVSSGVNILANNSASSNIEWYYYDFKTDTEIKLENFSRDQLVKGDIPFKSPSSPRIIESVGDREAPSVSVGGYTGTVYQYNVVPTGFGGIGRLIGRIYLNNDAMSNPDTYIERTFDIIVKAEAKQPEYNMEYNQVLEFKNISNDKGDSLEWGVDINNPSLKPEVVDLEKRATGGVAVGKYWGEQTLFLTALPILNKYDQWTTLNPSVMDTIKFTTAFTMLTGEVEEYRTKSTGYEVVDVEGNITLSTNAKGDRGVTYEWYYVEGNSEIKINDSNLSDSNGYITVAGINTFGGEYSGLTITGKKAGEVKILCRVTKDGETEERTTVIKVVDSFYLSENIRTIVKGDSFVLTAETSDLTGTVTWVSEDPKYVTVDPTGTRVTVTGVEVTGLDYITIRATHTPSGRTAVCKVRVTEKMSKVTIKGDTLLAKGNEGELYLDFEGTPPSFTADQLKWVLRDKDGKEAASILELTENGIRANIKGLEVGEVYVAVILTEVRGSNKVETELAVATVKVVTSPEGLELDVEEDIVDYLENGGRTLHATILPKGFVNNDFEIKWTITPDSGIATVAPNPENSLEAVVTYNEVGRVRVTAQIEGIPDASAWCYIDIQTGVDDFTLDPENMRLKVGEKQAINYTITPDNATDTTITWASNDTSVATVDGSGTVTAVKAGSAVITATASNGKTKQCIVTVLVPAESIVLNYDTITVKKGTVFYLNAQVLPIEAYDKTVRYVSSDDSIVTVEEDGTVTALKVGTAEITVISNDNPDLTEICTVNVIESVSGLTLNSREITIDVGEQYLLKATVRPSDSLNQEVTFESADPSIATVDENGLITGVKGGVTIIMVRTVERGLMATCTVTVQEDIESITFVETEIYLAKGANKKIAVTIVPASATQKKLLWKSSDESIVIVDADGNIHGVNLGTATITATARDEGKVFATCKVTVIDPMTKLTLNQSIIRIMQRDTYQLTYTVEPSYASVQRVNWTTSNAAVARVDSLGLVTGVAEGEATIRATASDGSGVYAECTVIVTPIILTTSVQVNTPETTMVLGDTRTLSARTQPRNTTEAIRWISSDSSVVTIDNNGNARAVGPGVCQIIAVSSVSGIEGTSTITVLGLNANTVTLEQYDTFDLQLSGVDAGVTWFSRNKRVATVTRRGVVTGRREGTTEVVARVNGKLVSCEVNVEKLRK